MADAVICDTNAVIQLAIICPTLLTSKNPKINFLVHFRVKQEIQTLKIDSDKNTRLGSVLDLILKSVPTESICRYPKQSDEIVKHKRIIKFEESMPDNQKSAGSSHADRCFLILAQTNKAILLTNERTLYNLGVTLLGQELTWSVSNAIERALALGLVSKEDVQAGLDELAKYKEHLRTECAEKIRQLGFRYE